MKLTLLGLFGGLTLLLAGCDRKTLYTVSGKVTFNEQATPEGHIAFLDEEGKGEGGPIVDGHYEVHVPAGKYQVQITASKKVQLPPGQVALPGETEESRQYIPTRYNANSVLQVEVTEATTHDFPLKPE